MLFYDGTVIYTAQLQKTSTETFEEMAQLMDTRALRKFLAPNGIRTALGREEIRLKSGAKMKFLARTRNGGNGQHGSLLIFDEATSALDNRTQKQVSEALDKMGCTRIVIAHRLSTIRHCDRILVLEGGSIVEDGRYDELIEKGGFFAELVERQRLDTAG
jgi:ABC-type multidrug transport system fused ATPase/permease subunit